MANNSITDKCEQNVYKSATAQNFSSVDVGNGLAREWIHVEQCHTAISAF